VPIYYSFIQNILRWVIRCSRGNFVRCFRSTRNCSAVCTLEVVPAVGRYCCHQRYWLEIWV